MNTRFIETNGKPILAIYLAEATFNEMVRHAVSNEEAINAWTKDTSTSHNHILTYSTAEDGEINAMHVNDAEGNNILYLRSELPAVA